EVAADEAGTAGDEQGFHCVRSFTRAVMLPAAPPGPRETDLSSPLGRRSIRLARAVRFREFGPRAEPVDRARAGCGIGHGDFDAVATEDAEGRPVRIRLAFHSDRGRAGQ